MAKEYDKPRDTRHAGRRPGKSSYLLQGEESHLRS